MSNESDPAYVMMRELGPIVRQQILTHFSADSCIASSKIGLLIAERLIETQAYALSVRVSIYNRALMDRAQAEGGLPRTRQQTMKWERESGAWSLGIGYPIPNAGPGRWPGHLVVIVNRRWLWDLSIDQANRPKYGIVFPAPVILPVTEAFLRGRERLTAWVANSWLMYDAFPEDKSFRDSPNWDIEVQLGRALRLDRLIRDMYPGKDPLRPPWTDPNLPSVSAQHWRRSLKTPPSDPS